MKITEVRTYTVGNPWKNWVFVKVFTDEGIIGIGEATGGLATKPAEAQVQELGRFLIGEDPLHHVDHLHAVPDLGPRPHGKRAAPVRVDVDALRQGEDVVRVV